MTSPTAPLSERIALLQGKVASPSPSQTEPSPSGSLASSGNGIKRAVTLRDKIAKFEEKGGVPIPRGSFGLGVPLTHAPQRTGGLYGVRVPELGKGGTIVLTTPSHSRRGSFAEGEGVDSDSPGHRDSRSPSPAPNVRLRTLSSTSNGKAAYLENSNYRRTMHFPGELNDKIDFTDIHGEDVPPVPALMPSAVIQESAPQLPETTRIAAVEPAGLRSDAMRDSRLDESDATEAPCDAGNEDSLTGGTPEGSISVLPLPAVLVEEVKTPMPGPTQQGLQTYLAPSTADFTGQSGNATDTYETTVPPYVQSHNSPSTQGSVESEPVLEDLLPSPILTPNTIDSFPDPPIILPSKVTVTPAAVASGNSQDDIPPPLPPKDEYQIAPSTALSQDASSTATLKSSKYSIDAPVTSGAQTKILSDRTSTPITSPSEIQSRATSIKRSISPRQPIVVPNWWEDDEDQEVDGGWATVVR